MMEKMMRKCAWDPCPYVSVAAWYVEVYVHGMRVCVSNFALNVHKHPS